MEKLKHVSGSTTPEKRDTLYKDLDGKIDVLRRVWTFASGLGIPTTTGNYEADDAIEKEETIAFESILEGENRRLLNGEQFTRQLWIGATRAIIKRGSVRESLMRLHQDPSLTWDDVIDDANDIKIASVKGNITKVVVKPYSMNVVVNHKAFVEIARSNNHRPDASAGGFSLYMSAFNVLDEQAIAEEMHLFRIYLDEETKEAQNDPRHPRPLYTFVATNEEEFEDTIYAHEDFHTFAEFMGLSLLPKIRDPFSQLISDVESGEKRTDSIIRSINTILDYGHEELLAELASVRLTRYEGSMSTFIVYANEKRQFLQNAITEARRLSGMVFFHDPSVNRAIAALNRAKINGFITGMYERVRQSAPEKTGDLDMAFALFPPSQWKHVRRMVNRWTSQQAT